MLKDGQVAEQGNFKELLELDGIFASMWADQVSSNEDPSLSLAEGSIQKEAVGYVVDTQESTGDQIAELAALPTSVNQTSVTEPLEPNDQAAQVEDKGQNEGSNETSADSAVPFPTSTNIDPATKDKDEDRIEIPGEQPVAQVPTPTTTIPFPAPIAFPTSDSASEIRRVDTPPIVSPPAVTFDANVNSPPSRTGTPDVEGETKRKRISSQNFQRLARRISLTTRRSSSSVIPGIPGFKRDQSPRVSTDDNRPEGSAAGPSNQSPAASVKGDDKGKLKKKDKKKKDTL